MSRRTKMERLDHWLVCLVADLSIMIVASTGTQESGQGWITFAGLGLVVAVTIGFAVAA